MIRTIIGALLGRELDRRHVVDVGERRERQRGGGARAAEQRLRLAVEREQQRVLEAVPQLVARAE